MIRFFCVPSPFLLRLKENAQINEALLFCANFWIFVSTSQRKKGKEPKNALIVRRPKEKKCSFLEVSNWRYSNATRTLMHFLKTKSMFICLFFNRLCFYEKL